MRAERGFIPKGDHRFSWHRLNGRLEDFHDILPVAFLTEDHVSAGLDQRPTALPARDRDHAWRVFHREYCENHCWTVRRRLSVLESMPLVGRAFSSGSLAIASIP